MESKSQTKRRFIQKGGSLADLMDATLVKAGKAPRFTKEKLVKASAKTAVKRADKHIAAAKVAKAAQDTREQWLNRGVVEFREIFKAAGHELPPVKVSCSWPGGGSARKRLGECWPKSYSKGDINELFISPVIADPVIALGILAHELCHAMDNCQSGHKAAFKKIGASIGLEGKPSQMAPGDALKAKLEAMVKKIGAYPHNQLDLSKRKKQGTRLVKCQCPSCEAVWRATQSWIDRANGEYGGVTCFVCGEQAESGSTDGDEDGDE